MPRECRDGLGDFLDLAGLSLGIPEGKRFKWLSFVWALIRTITVCSGRNPSFGLMKSYFLSFKFLSSLVHLPNSWVEVPFPQDTGP